MAEDGEDDMKSFLDQIPTAGFGDPEMDSMEAEEVLRGLGAEAIPWPMMDGRFGGGTRLIVSEEDGRAASRRGVRPVDAPDLGKAVEELTRNEFGYPVLKDS